MRCPRKISHVQILILCVLPTANFCYMNPVRTLEIDRIVNMSPAHQNITGALLDKSAHFHFYPFSTTGSPLVKPGSDHMTMENSDFGRTGNSASLTQLFLDAIMSPFRESLRSLNVEQKLQNPEIEDATLLVPDLVRKQGYPIETHVITTADGYQLTLHRIPYGFNNNYYYKHKETQSADQEAIPEPIPEAKMTFPFPGPEGQSVVFLQHGLLCSSADWLINPPYKALGFMLADAGYDVWLGNARGNTYSKGHVSLNESDHAYWDFSWHEMGDYDIPAVIDYILQSTRQDSLTYIGHSMGTTIFWIAMSLHPEYNAKIRMMIALAPVAYLDHIRSPIRYIAPFSTSIQWILKAMGQYEFLPDSDLTQFLGYTLCNERSLANVVCTNILFLICGYDSQQLNYTMLPVILGHSPAGSSVNTLVHYAQLVQSQSFRFYDHGMEGNYARYGMPIPPSYDLSKVTTPVAMFWGANDWLSTAPDIHRLATQLPNVVYNHRVAFDMFNHLDFLWAKDADILLYNHILQLIKKFPVNVYSSYK